MSAKRSLNTIKHPQRRRLGDRAHVTQIVQVLLVKHIVRIVSEQTPEERAATRALFHEHFPNFHTAR